MADGGTSLYRNQPDIKACRVNNGLPGDVKAVGRGVSELRIHYGPGYRVYYCQDGDQLILLLCGGDKGTQQRDIEVAHRLAAEWRAS
ncbi:type II toxin-antitoxin system RelE/ParE family toxin [Halomonas cupida]|uniref:type II toxin-antitoxin system RelE/ParE family toxin n=1 Tax=Halomonas cupida TaxID=44933 RepID=UPI003A94FA6D